MRGGRLRRTGHAEVDKALAYSPFVHNYREQRMDRRFVARPVDCSGPGVTSFKIVRNPFARAASTFAHQMFSHFSDGLTDHPRINSALFWNSSTRPRDRWSASTFSSVAIHVQVITKPNLIMSASIGGVPSTTFGAPSQTCACTCSHVRLKKRSRYPESKIPGFRLPRAHTAPHTFTGARKGVLVAVAAVKTRRRLARTS